MYKIAELNKPSAVPQIALRTDEVARALGVSASCVRRLVRDTDIPAVRLPGSRVIIFPVREIQEWIAKYMTQSAKGGEAK